MGRVCGLLVIALVLLQSVGSVADDIQVSQAEIHKLADAFAQLSTKLASSEAPIFALLAGAVRRVGPLIESSLTATELNQITSSLNSVGDFSQAMQQAEAVVMLMDTDVLAHTQFCLYANLSSGCDVISHASQLLNAFSTHREQLNRLVPNGGPHGSRPVADDGTFQYNAFYSAHVETGRAGEGYVTLASRFFFWIAVAVVYGFRVAEIITEGMKNNQAIRIVKLERWRLIFSIYPEFETWVRTLTVHDDIPLLTSELCEQPYNPTYLSPNGVKLHAFDEDVDLVWSNPILSNHNEMDYTPISQGTRNKLRECWDKMANVLALQRPGVQDHVMHTAPRLIVVLLALFVFVSEARAQNSDCPDFDISDGGSSQCTNANKFASICVKTCEGKNLRIDWTSQSNTGQVMACGSGGSWVGEFVKCVSA